MNIKLSSVDDFLKYYDMGYRVSKHDLMLQYKISEKTFYRNIGNSDSDVSKVKMSVSLQREIKGLYGVDDRLTEKHIDVVEKKILFNEYEVFEYLVAIGEFKMYLNVVGTVNISNYINLGESTRDTLDLFMNNYDVIMKYLWQSHKLLYINALKIMGRRYDLSNETDRARYKRDLKKVPHIKFEVCGTMKYVSLQHGYYYAESLDDIHKNFLSDFNHKQLEFELFNEEVMMDIEQKIEKNNIKVIDKVEEYLSIASDGKREQFFIKNKHLGESFLKQFDEYR